MSDVLFECSHILCSMLTRRNPIHGIIMKLRRLKIYNNINGRGNIPVNEKHYKMYIFDENGQTNVSYN